MLPNCISLPLVPLPGGGDAGGGAGPGNDGGPIEYHDRMEKARQKPKWSTMRNGMRTLRLDGVVTIREGEKSAAGAATMVVRVAYDKAGGDTVPCAVLWHLEPAFDPGFAGGAIEFWSGGLCLRGAVPEMLYLGMWAKRTVRAGALPKLKGEGELHGLAEAGLFPPPEM
jgi:hypothetical protein